MTRGRDIDRFFRLFPEPDMARDLFNILEDYRIESRLKHEYPVLGDQLSDINRFMLNKRPALDDMAGDKQRAVEIIGQWLNTGCTKEDIPTRLKKTIEFARTAAKKLDAPSSDVHNVADTASEIYFHIDDLFPKDAYRPVLPFSAFIDPAKTAGFDSRLGGASNDSPEKSEKDPEKNAEPSVLRKEDADPENIVSKDDPAKPLETSPPKQGKEFLHFSDLPDIQSNRSTLKNEETDGKKRGIRVAFDDDGTTGRKNDIGEDVVKTARPDPNAPPAGRAMAGGNELTAASGHLYPEWGNDIGCYRINWARVLEHAAAPGGDDFYQSTLMKYAGLIKKVKREFQMLRPEGLMKLKRQVEGDEIDLDAAVEFFIDRKVGITPSEKNYIRTKKNNRDIAVAFLIDMSGSTRGGTISTEKEALIIMSEALCEIGDAFAVYGFSGHGREKVDFFVIKPFSHPYGRETARHISSIHAHHSTRMGPAIRHAHTKLGQRHEKIKMLILLSDGKPEDKGYKDAYGIEDTRMALKEGATHGIRQFCITVDTAAPAYLHRMYSHSNWVVISHVEKLPWKITKIYRRLTT